MTAPPRQNDSRRRGWSVFGARSQLIAANDPNRRVQPITLVPELLDQERMVRWPLFDGEVEFGQMVPASLDGLRHRVHADMAPCSCQLDGRHVPVVLRRQARGKILVELRFQIVGDGGSAMADAAQAIDLNGMVTPVGEKHDT